MPTFALDEEVCLDQATLSELHKLILKLRKLLAMLKNVVAISRGASNNGFHL